MVLMRGNREKPDTTRLGIHSPLLDLHKEGRPGLEALLLPEVDLHLRWGQGYLQIRQDALLGTS